MHSHTLLNLLGLRHTPERGMSRVLVEGVTVWADPLFPGSSFRLRMRAECPACGEEMAAGRLFQHFKVHQ